jgi:hypothetical protein
MCNVTAINSWIAQRLLLTVATRQSSLLPTPWNFTGSSRSVIFRPGRDSNCYGSSFLEFTTGLCRFCSCCCWTSHEMLDTHAPCSRTKAPHLHTAFLKFSPSLSLQMEIWNRRIAQVMSCFVCNVKVSLEVAVDDHRVWGVKFPYFFLTTFLEMALKLSVSRAGFSFRQKIHSRISVRGWVDSKIIVELEGLSRLKNLMAYSNIEPATLRLAVQCLNQPYYCVPPSVGKAVQLFMLAEASSITVKRVLTNALMLYTDIVYLLSRLLRCDKYWHEGNNWGKFSDNPDRQTRIWVRLKYRMPSSGMLCRVGLVRINVSEECSTSIIRVTRIGDLGTTLAVTNNQSTLRRNVGSYKSHTA